MKTSMRLIVEELRRRTIPVEVMYLAEGRPMAYFNYNKKQHVLTGTISDLTSYTGRLIADDKAVSTALARDLDIPTPATIAYESLQSAEAFLETHGTVVVKPLDSAHGNGITTGVTSLRDIKRAVTLARSFSEQVILQQQVDGVDLRVLVVGGEVIAVSERVPAMVVGDGVHTIKDLIESENQNPRRGVNYEKPLNKIDHTIAREFLGSKKLKQVPAKGETVQVVGTANIGSGGHAVNKTNEIPDEIARQSIRFVEATNLFTCGVDFLYNEAAQRWYFIEANGSPSLGLHLWPEVGEPVDVTRLFVDKLLAAYES